MMSRLPSILENEIQLTLLLRQQMIVAIDSFFVKSLAKLLTDLEIIDREKLPEDVINTLEDKLSGRDISMRLKGVADALFHIYGKEVDKGSINKYLFVGCLPHTVGGIVKGNTIN